MDWERKVHIAKVESALLQGFRRYMENEGFVEVQVPHITKATGACENIATMFDLNYFGRKAYLTQTGQLQLEIFSQLIGKVFTLIKSFRAEPKVDERHLTEFSLFEFEHIGNLSELLRHIENTIYSGIKEVSQVAKKELQFFDIENEWLETFKPPYKKLTYEKVIEFLNENGFNLKFGDDLKSQHEKKVAKEFGPTFITHWPKKLKFFNMAEVPDRPEIVESADLELPYVGESVGSAQREINHIRLKERLMESHMFKMLIEKGGDIKDWDWYLEFWEKYKNPKVHSGCGIGVSRVVQSLLRLDSIKDAVIYPMDRISIY